MVRIQGNVLHLCLERKVDESYDIVFGFDLFGDIAKWLRERQLGSVYAIVTDSKVRELYASLLESSLINAGLNVNTFSFPAGEQNKTMANCMQVIGQMSELRYGRDSAILALGGGVVGDMAGFIAAIFNRGIPYVQIPTTVLAQADSAVGGKTAVDTEFGKNLVGAFHQPVRVYVDIATLATLSEDEFRNGIAETIKHGVIRDAGFFGYLNLNIDLIMDRDEAAALSIAEENCKIKGVVVAVDPNEKGLRRILNYGHTVGHAVEKLAGYSLPHGYCISIGMMVAGRIARELGYFPQNELERQEKILRRAGLPVKIPPEIADLDIIEVTSRDKKAKGGKARYCLPKRIGEMNDFGGNYVIPVENDVVRKALEETR